MYIYSVFLFVLLIILILRNQNIMIFAKIKISYALPCAVILSGIFYFFTHTFELGDYVMMLFISPLYLINVLYIIASSVIITYMISKSTGICKNGVFSSIFNAKKPITWDKIHRIEVYRLEKCIVILYFDNNDQQIAKNIFNKRVLPYIEQKFNNLSILCKYI